MSMADLRAVYEREQVNQVTIEACIRNRRAELLNSLATIHGDGEPVVKNRLLKICELFLPSYAKADVLAGKYQSYYKTGSTLIYMLAALAILSASAESLFPVVPHQAILIEIASISCIIFIFTYGNLKGWHRRWLDYRYLAERFRFAVFMALMREKVSTGFSRHDLYHPAHFDHWVFLCMRETWNTWENLDLPRLSDPDSYKIIKQFIRIAWIEDQKTYHYKNVIKQLTKHKRLSLLSEILFFLTFAAAVAHYFHWGGHSLSPSLTFASISFPALGAAFSGLRAHFEHNKLARRSEQMVKHLAIIETDLDAVTDMDGLLQVAHEAETLMLNENSDWHAIIGYHALEKPA